MLPSGSAERLPSSVVLFIGSVMDLLEPAFATGDIFAAGFTVTEITSELVAPLLSVTVNEKTYAPWINPETSVEEFVGEVIKD
jgi:hypothetical protein